MWAAQRSRAAPAAGSRNLNGTQQSNAQRQQGGSAPASMDQKATNDNQVRQDAPTSASATQQNTASPVADGSQNSNNGNIRQSNGDPGARAVGNNVYKIQQTNIQRQPSSGSTAPQEAQKTNQKAQQAPADAAKTQTNQHAPVAGPVSGANNGNVDQRGQRTGRRRHGGARTSWPDLPASRGDRRLGRPFGPLDLNLEEYEGSRAPRPRRGSRGRVFAGAWSRNRAGWRKVRVMVSLRVLMASTRKLSVRAALRRGCTTSLLASAAIVLSLAIAGPAGAVTSPTFANYAAPAPLGQDAGEPSIGINWKTDQVLYQAGLQTLKVDFSSAAPAWRDVSSTITSITGLDPILFTDHSTGRTFVSQLLGACSLMAFSDDDGASWTQNPLGCGIGAAVDHQTVGGGSFHVGVLGPLTGYQHSVYYCAQAAVSAQCSVSQTGGAVFNPATSIYNTTQCNGLHGHLKVGPDGSAYVPNADCGGKAAAVTSTDNGLTWKVDAVPDSSTQDESDPSIGVGAGGSTYLGYQGKDGHAYISVKRPGATWATSTDVGKAVGIQNVQFPAVVAGDDDRASFAFLGTTTGGDDQAATFAGVWHLYVATTYDAGASWSTVDATPTDPVQRGCIWLGGGSNTCRNLLDFMGAEIDSHGQVHVAYADGCTASCASGGTNTHTALATIARQTAGTGLLSASDPPAATTASVPAGG